MDRRTIKPLMLEFIRQYRSLFSIVFVLAAIGLVVSMFGAPGSGGMLGGGGSLAQGNVARVNGEAIPSRELLMALNNQLARIDELVEEQTKNSPNRAEMRQFLERMYKSQLTPDAVLSELIQAELMSQAADRVGIVSSPASIRDVIAANPEFQEKGVFSVVRYKSMVPKPSEYEGRIAEYLQRLTFNSAFEAGLSVMGELEKSESAWLEKPRRFEALLVNPKKWPEPAQVSAAQVEEFLKSSDSEAVLKAFYDRNIKEFKTDEQLRARHILIRDKQKGKDTLTKLRAEIVAKKLTFEQAAKSNSEDTSNAANGGDLGFFGKGVMDPAFESAAFGLKEPASLSEPVETSFGWHLIELVERKAASERAFESVRSEIASRALLESLRDQRARAWVQEMAQGSRKFSEAEMKRLNLRWDSAVTWTPLSTSIGPYSTEGRESDLLALEASGTVLKTPLTQGENLVLVRYLGEDAAAKAPSVVQTKRLKGETAFGFFMRQKMDDLEKRKKIVRSTKLLEEIQKAMQESSGG
jgi:peptidyl-prolyl cis-trans isomerase D